MKKPLYSIVIPSSGRILELKAALDSLQKQTLSDFEVIVVEYREKEKTEQQKKKKRRGETKVG